MKKALVIGVMTTSLIFGALFFLPQQQVAAACDTGGFFGFPSWYEYLPHDSTGGSCDVSSIPDGDGNVDIGATVGAVLMALTEILLRVAGIVAVGFILYGGILYTMSQGEPERLGAARKTIINGIIGLVIAVLAVAVVNLVTNIIM